MLKSSKKVYSGNESESESDNSHSSDVSYVPSAEELRSIENQQEKDEEKKIGKKQLSSNGNTSQKPHLKKRKVDKPSVKNKNHNDFFKNIHGSISELPGTSVETATNAETIIMVEGSSESIQKSPHISEKNDDDSKKSVEDDIRELKHMMHGMQRQLARVETLIKFQKEAAGDSTDAQSRKETYIEILQSYGLPITSKEKLDEIEQNLKDVDFKKKLV